MNKRKIFKKSDRGLRTQVNTSAAADTFLSVYPDHMKTSPYSLFP
jgi:hypothetical protein